MVLIATRSVIAFAGFILALNVGSALAQEGMAPLSADLEAAKAALAKYEDPYVAVRDGYLSTVACVEWPTGGMGVHFVNFATISPTPDPAKPQVLIYQLDGDRLRLGAAEWFIPLATGVKERPVIFGQPFDGPMEGHEPLIPADLHHYDLHVWLWKPNPAGIFHATNPDVQCPANSTYTLVDEPSPIVEHVTHE